MLGSAASAAGGYAAFVWPAYAISALVLAGATAESVARARRWRRRVEALEAERRAAADDRADDRADRA